MPATLVHARRWLSTLKFRIVFLAILTGLLSAMGTAYLVLRTAQQSIERVVLTSAKTDRERLASVLSGKVSVLRDALSAVARRTPEQAWADPAAMQRYLLDKPALDSLFSSVFAADTSGRMLTRVEDGVAMAQLPNVADRDYFRQAMASDQPVISEVLVGKIAQRPMIVVAIPVMDADGKPLGLLAGALLLHSVALFDELKLSALDDAVWDLVVDRSGRILSHQNPTHVMQSALHEPGLDRVLRAWQAAGSPIDTVGSASIEGEYVVSLAGIPLTDWLHVRMTKADVAMAPVNEARLAALPAALLAGTVAGLLAGALAYRFTRPISRLQQRAEVLLDSAEGVSRWPEDAGEVGQLARVFRHVVEQRERRQTEVQALLAQLEAVLDHAEVGIALSRRGKFELVSLQFCHVFRCNKADAIGQATRMIYPSDAAFQALVAEAGPALTQTGVLDTELELIRRNGQVFWARMRGRAVVAGDVSQGTIWTIEDVTAARAQREQLAYTASHDALTGLVNRVAFEQLLDDATGAASDQSFCALFIDLDRFKQVNDTGGHAAGDALLRDIGQLLGHAVRKSDVVARLGGDEFAVLLPGCPADQAHAVADKLCTAVRRYELVWNGRRFGVGASIGLVVVDSSFKTSADVLRAADSACYDAKKRGRSRVEQYLASDLQPLEIG
jgi:diguanylate cyclase (GGDEF)-like protein/PAS domain S-box-containing protein